VSETRSLARIYHFKPVPACSSECTTPNPKSETAFAANRINKVTFKTEIEKTDELVRSPIANTTSPMIAWVTLALFDDLAADFCGGGLTQSLSSFSPSGESRAMRS
jgi:hypothetical protein